MAVHTVSRVAGAVPIVCSVVSGAVLSVNTAKGSDSPVPKGTAPAAPSATVIASGAGLP